MTDHRRDPLKPCVSKTIASPVGDLTLVATRDGLAAVLWWNDAPNRVRLNIIGTAANDPILVETERQLDAYFAGRHRTFDLTLDLIGTTFQTKVWHALLAIPFGETRSYGQIARHIGHPTAVRAVGAANGRNPVSIIAPCHRVVGATGTLTGFAGGLAAKAFLLDMEARAVGRISVAGSREPSQPRLL